MPKITTKQNDSKLLEYTITNGFDTTVKRCLHIKNNGEQCRAVASNSTNGSQLCPIHGGLKPWDSHRNGITKSLTDVLISLGRVWKDTKAGKMQPQVANALTNVANSAIKVHEIIEIQKYLSENVNKQAKNELTDSIPADYTLED